MLQRPTHKVKQHRLHRIGVMSNDNVTDKDKDKDKDTTQRQARRTVSMQKS